MPVSEKQRAANRANASHSTGPKTPEGKARSSQNARKHGLRAESFTIVAIEDPESFAELRANAIAVYRPANSQELHAVERIAQCQLEFERTARLQAALFTSHIDQVVSPYRDSIPDLCEDLNTPPNPALNGTFCFGEAFRRVNPKLYIAVLRHQAQNERLYRRAIEEFDRLKSLRGELGSDPPDEPEEVSPNEPDSGADPEQPESFTPTPNEPDCGGAAHPVPGPTSPLEKSLLLSAFPPFPPILRGEALPARTTALSTTTPLCYTDPQRINL